MRIPRVLAGLVLVAAGPLTIWSLLGDVSAIPAASRQAPAASTPIAGAPALERARSVAAPPPARRPARRPAGIADAPDPTGKARFEVVVIAGLDEPLAGARVVLFEPGRAPMSRGPLEPIVVAPLAARREASTDARGRAVFEQPEAGALGVLVLAPGRPPAHALVERPEGECTLRLADDLCAAGRVTVDGGPPREPLALEVRGFVDPTLDWSPDARDAVRRAGGGADRLSIAVDRGGSFEVRGLPELGALTLSAPDAYRSRAGAEPSWTVPFGAAGVHVDLVRLPRLRVRAVQADGPLAAPAELVARVRIEPVAGAPLVDERELRLGEDLDVPVRTDSLARVELVIVAREDGSVLGSAALDAPTLDPAEVLEIPVPQPGAELRLRVIADDGAALEGARAFLAGRRYGPADASGVLDLRVLECERELTVGAPGRASLRVELPWPPPDDRVVVLPGANRLAVRVRLLDPRRSLDGLGIRLRAPETPGTRAAALLDRSDPGALTPDGTWSRWDLPVDVPLRVTLHDRHGYGLRQSVVSLGPREARELVFELHEPPQPLFGRVVDGAGRPLPGAGVYVGTSIWPAAVCDEAGWFELTDVHDPNPTVRLSAEGHASREVRGPGLLQGLDFALQPARTLWIEVRGPEGPTDVDRLWCDLPDGSARPAWRQGVGLYRFDALPRAAGVLRCVNPDGTAVVSSSDSHLRLAVAP